MSTQILLRRGTAQQWIDANPLLSAGEPGVETDTGKFKIGDGILSWLSLPYAVGEIPTDLSDLSDDENLIPTDINQLTDNDGRFDAVVQQLTDDLTEVSNTIPTSLADLNFPEGTQGQVLTAGAGGTLGFQDPLVAELDDLADVNIQGETEGEVLRYNGSTWVNGPFPPDDDTKYDLTAIAKQGGGATVTLSGTDSVIRSFDVVSNPIRTGVEVAVVDNNIELSLNTQLTSFNGGIIFNPSTEMQLASAAGRITTGFPNGTTVEVTNAVGSGSIVTMVFDEEDIPPFAVGSTISVSGMNPINYNGEYTVVSCTPTQVTFNSSVTAAFVSGGEINGRKLADNGSLLIGLPFYEATRPAINILQAHETAAAMNISFTRSRGTSLAQEILQNGDALGGIAAVGRGTSALGPAASIGFAVEGSPGANVPGKIQFATNNGTAFGLRAELSPTGQFKVNSITSLSGNLILNATSGVVQLPAGTTIGGVTIGTLNLQGAVNEIANLPPTGNTVGHAYIVLNVADSGPASLAIWTGGGGWVDVGDIQGPPGEGVPTGGTVGQVLAKTTGSNYATQWITPFDGNYGSLFGSPDFAAVATSGQFADLLGKPDLAIVATTGDYQDLINLPIIPLEQVNADWNATTGKAAIFNKPIIPANPVNADWNSSIGLSEILNKPIIPSNLTELGIVDGTAGQVLTTDGDGGFTFTTVSGGGGATTLDGLSDVVITGTPTNGQVLKYDGTNWVNGTDATGGAADGNTTYGISAETATGGVNLRLTGSDSSTDNVKLTAGTNITLTRTSADEITIAAAAGDGGGGGLVSRAEVSAASSSLANNAVGPINITGYKAYALLKVQTSAAAWVRIYTSEAARQADASRTEGTDPLPGSGVIAEVITTGAQTVLISPGTIGFNDETVVTTNIPVRVTNKSGSTQAITVTLTAIQLEA
jgi:hypothetical protein